MLMRGNNGNSDPALTRPAADVISCLGLAPGQVQINCMSSNSDGGYVDLSVSADRDMELGMIDELRFEPEQPRDPRAPTLCGQVGRVTVRAHLLFDGQQSPEARFR